MRNNLREFISSPLVDRDGELRLSGRAWGFVFGALGATLFSLKAIFVKLAYQPVGDVSLNEIDAITLMALRLGFSMPIYIFILLWSFKKLKQNDQPLPSFKNMALAGALGLVGYYICAFLDIQALKYVTAQLERILLFTYPVFVLLISAVFLGYRPKPLSVASIILGYIGIVVIFAGGDITEGENLLLGTMMLLACALLFAGFQLLAKPMISRLGSTVFTCCAMITAGIVIFAHLIVSNAVSGELGTLGQLPARIWMLGIALAFISTLIPSFLVNIAIGRIGAQSTAMLGMLSPVATIIFAIIWLGEPFGLYDGIGTALTLAGIGFYSWYSRKDSQAAIQSQPKALAK